MKVYISADIEGTATTTVWDDARVFSGNTAPAAAHQKQMTEEILAACRGAIKAGATEIVINDAHSRGLNIIPEELPECASIIRGWSGHPFLMVEQVDETFDAAMFVGYHSAAGLGGSPLSHTLSLEISEIYVNGIQASEFLFYSWACALKGVPAVYMSADKQMCEDGVKLWPKLVTTATKEGLGSAAKCVAPQKVLRMIEEDASRALSQDLKSAKINLPDYFKVKIIYKEPTRAFRVSFYPGVTLINDNTIEFEHKDFFEILRTIMFVCHYEYK